MALDAWSIAMEAMTDKIKSGEFKAFDITALTGLIKLASVKITEESDYYSQAQRAAKAIEEMGGLPTFDDDDDIHVQSHNDGASAPYDYRA